MRIRILLSAAASVFALSLLFSATGALDPASWTFTSIDVPDADLTFVRDMNSAGQIVGEYYIESKDEYRGFLFRNGVFTPIVVGDYSAARGINTHGEIAGLFESSVDGYLLHGYLLSKGTVTQIDYPGAEYTAAEAINAVGDVVGYYGLGGTEHGFLQHCGVLTTIDYPGAYATNVRGINSEGDMVGLYTNNNDPNDWWNGPFHGFLLSRHGTFRTVDYPESSNGNVNGINDRGQLVGEVFVGVDTIQGFLLSKDMYSPISYPGATTTRPWKITADGQHIVGFYDDQHGFVLSRKLLN
jgi:uncharacterized membrane protein